MLEQGPNIDVGNIYTGDRYLPDRVRKLGLKTMPIDGKSRPNVSSLKLGHTSRERLRPSWASYYKNREGFIRKASVKASSLDVKVREPLKHMRTITSTKVK